MCKLAGPRCSHYAQDTLNIVARRQQKAADELQAYEDKYADVLLKEEDLNKSDIIHQHKHQRLVDAAKEQSDKLEQAKFDYYSTPLGQEELQKNIDDAIEAGDEEAQKRAEEILAVANEHRKWQRHAGKTLREIEAAEGPEAALEEAQRRAAELETSKEETETKLLEAQTELLELEAENAKDDAEIAELEEKVEELEKTEEELAEEERVKLALAKKRMRNRIILIGAVLGAIFTYQLIMHATTGKQSQMMQYAKSAATRRGVGMAQNTLQNIFTAKAKA